VTGLDRRHATTVVVMGTMDTKELVGPIALPEDVREILKLVPVQGFVGASSIERLPVENGIRDAVAAFAAIPLRT